MKRKPINVTANGCAFTIRTGYERHACLNGMTRGGLLPGNRSLGDVVGYINSSQDGAICHRNATVPCLTSGHGNCPKVIVYEESGTSIVEHPSPSGSE